MGNQSRDVAQVKKLEEAMLWLQHVVQQWKLHEEHELVHDVGLVW